MKDLKDFQENLLKCLGGEWPEPCPLAPQMEDSIARIGYRIEKVTYQVEPGERVPAYVLVPDHVTPTSKAPAIAVWHQHNNNWALGKSEPAGLIGDPTQFTGVALARLGYVVLCPDALCFEERQDSILRGGDFERFIFLRYLVNGKCLAWKYILDMRRSIDYLRWRADVNASAIGCYGHSLGSIFTWLVGPWEKRLKCLVGNCALPTYSAIDENRRLAGFGIFIPGLNQYGDTPDIVALIAPRPLHLNFGTEDRHSPIFDVRIAMGTIEKAYANYQQNFTYFIEENQRHLLSEQMWEHVRAKFLKYLPLN
ncbi:MAG: alpha/beta hydrolase family protein [Rhizonema sp. PD38]|nr:alpha/beta hydrolase family protein [Rhizonema sp. PD38]